MTDRSVLEQLDEAVDFVIAHHRAAPPRVTPAIDELLQVAAGMRHVARPEFKAQLKTALREHSEPVTRPQRVGRPVAAPVLNSGDDSKLLPTLFGSGYGSYPVHRSNFVASFTVHAAAIALVLASSLWVTRWSVAKHESVVAVLTDVSPYVLPAAPDEARGGGGGGDRDKIQASKGELPKFSMQQITPAMRVVRNDKPTLVVAPSLIVPPQVHIASAMPVLGDPLSRNVSGPPSN